ncbi:nitroreductase family deazaflavin-dependent oxidoreductase [Streptomyces sp. NPDC002514]|uniref:nitroreductase family deazaflavin-dependent oxidoreductase n=1 Tax=Streptomyces sp. NPDC001270 TaxID=3364554 RepID=UPI0036BDE416
MPEEGGRSWLLVGSNFGRTEHPAWTYNLLARPEASINWRGEDIAVTARLLEGEERTAAWRALLAFWPPYAAYQDRVARRIRVSGWSGSDARRRREADSAAHAPAAAGVRRAVMSW